MLRDIVILFLGTCMVFNVNGNLCRDCTGVARKPVCGADNITYPSFCELVRIECKLGAPIGFLCDGFCPCDPAGIEKLDKKTFKKLQNLRKDIQLEGHEEEDFDNDSDDIVTLEILEDQNLKKQLEGEEDRGYLMEDAADGCPTSERVELPRRLIDWFHVLKTNEKEQAYKDQGIEREPILKELKFIDAKLKAMYARLACGDNDEEVEKEVCLEPVRWMFEHMDKNQDDILSPIELLDIEEINSERCIKPFLRSCDQNSDNNVVLNEFCKCLCFTPPCTHALENIPTVLIRGEPRPFPGLFEPKCDEDGFFMPLQHNKIKGEYWCVNRNGAEIDGTRNKTKIACELNTKETKEYHNLIPMDMQKENEPISEK